MHKKKTGHDYNTKKCMTTNQKYFSTRTETLLFQKCVPHTKFDINFFIIAQKP